MFGTPTPTIMDLRDFAGLPAMGRFFQSGFNVQALRTHTLLMRDDWLMMDERIVEVGAATLNGIADLQAFGLSFPNGGLGTMISGYTQSSQLRAATVTMDPRVDAERDRLDFVPVNVPVPIIMCPFELNIRELAASRQHGHALDVTHIDDAIRSVSEGMESMLFLGNALVIQGTTIYGYTTHPSRNTTSGGDWGTATNIYPNVLTMLGIMTNDKFPPPYRLYLHGDQHAQMLALSANTATPILSLVESLPGFGRGSVVVSDMVPAGQGVMVSMNRRAVDLSVGQFTTVVEWSEKGGMASEFIVLACLVPRVKSTGTGQSGVVHISSI